MTEKQATAALLWAQERLGLESWVIDVEWGGVPEWADPEASGQTEAWPQSRVARLWVNVGERSVAALDERFCKPKDRDLHTLFHELAHVALFDAGSPADSVGEFFINTVASLLVDSYSKRRA